MRQKRRSKGSALTLIIIICMAAFASSLVAAAPVVKFICLKQRLQLACEAGSLAAANSLSSVVINDPDYGYIGLSDFAPSSTKLLGADGKPLPVTGINTIINTARTGMIIASKLNNQEMLRLARLDAKRAAAASQRLTKVLKVALEEKPASASQIEPGLLIRTDSSANGAASLILDKDGKPVRPLTAAKIAFLKNLGCDLSRCGANTNTNTNANTYTNSNTNPNANKNSNSNTNTSSNANSNANTNYLSEANLKSIKLDLGYLRPESFNESNAPIPLPKTLAEVPATLRVNLDKMDNYPAYQNLPVENEEFIYAALGKQSSLVNSGSFCADNGKMPSCIVKLTTEMEMNDANALGLNKVLSQSCAMPYSLPDRSAAGTMVLGLPQGLPGSYHSMQDFLTDHRLSGSIAPLYSAAGGDYPQDSDAELRETTVGESQSTVADVFALGLHDWLRTAHGRLKLDSVLETIASRIQPTQGSFRDGESMVYRLDKQGRVSVDGYLVSAVSSQVVHENQIYTLLWGGVKSSNGNWNLAFRDQVRQLGPTTGGKHAGQLMECDGSFRAIGVQTGDTKVSDHTNSERKAYFDGGLAVEFVLTGDTSYIAQGLGR